MSKEITNLRLSREQYAVLSKKIAQKFKKKSNLIQEINEVSNSRVIGKESKPLRPRHSCLYFPASYDTWLNPYSPGLAKAILTIFDYDSELNFLEPVASKCLTEMKKNSGNDITSADLHESVNDRISYLVEYVHDNPSKQVRLKVLSGLEKFIKEIEPTKEILTQERAAELMSQGFKPGQIGVFFSGLSYTRLYKLQRELKK